jgi:hypothetical protein
MPRPRIAAELTMREEILRSAATGLAACLIRLWLAGGSPAYIGAAVIWGCCIGALIGLLLWSSSPDAPEEPIVPPSPEQARSARSGKARQRR